MYKVYEIKKRIFDDNDQEAEKVRQELKEDKTFLINFSKLIPESSEFPVPLF